MVDDVFRSYRNHDTAARDGSETSRGGIGDLLAELARLTGQGDPYRDGGRDDGFQARKDDSSLAPATIPCTARARQAEEGAIQQTFFPTRGQIQWLPWESQRPSGGD